MEQQPIRAPSPTLWRLIIALSDLSEAQAFIVAARKHGIASIEHEALLECAVIRYARPFTSNERDKKNAAADSKLTLSAPLINVFRVQEHVDLHKRILTLRHTVVAHVPAAQCPVTVTDSIPAPPGIQIPGWGWRGRPQRLADARLDLGAFHDMAWMMHYWCVNELICAKRREDDLKAWTGTEP